MDKEELMRFYKGPPAPTPVTTYTLFGKTLEVRERWVLDQADPGGDTKRKFEFRANWKLKGSSRTAQVASEDDSTFDKARLAKIQAEQEAGWKPVCQCSLAFVRIESSFRLTVLWTVEQQAFDHFILLVISLNSLLIGVYHQREIESPINEFADAVDPFLTVLFTLECLLKVVAYGFIRDPNAYLRDGWNRLDFLVVVTGLMSYMEIEGLPTTDGLRVFRVLRPLRSMNVVPEMKRIVNTVLLSIPALGNVGMMAMFLMVIFGILAIHLWSGVMYRQCRLFEQPFLLYGDSIESRCWSYPLDPRSSGRLCGGGYNCEHGGYCMSTFKDPNDIHVPQFRIADATPGFNVGDEVPPPWSTPVKGQPEPIPWCNHEGLVSNSTNWERAAWGIQTGDFNYGITTFDNLPVALLVIFQCITMEGWVDVMYMAQDASSNLGSAVYFVTLMVLGSLFLLNVALAVVWDAFSSLQEKAQEDKSPESGEEAGSDEDRRGSRPEPVLGEEVEQYWLDRKFVRKVYKVAEGDLFQNSIMFFISLNVLTMMMDRYPAPPPWQQIMVKTCNTIFNGVFFVEFLILHVAYGPKKYWTSMTTLFDGVIVITSCLELVLSGDGVFSVFRGFRLLRIFKLAKKWTSFRVLVKAMVKTVLSMSHFTCVMGLMMYVFTLMGMTFFARQFRFVEMDDGHKVRISDADRQKYYAYCPNENDPHDVSCIPRAHFDNFLWALVTCFQILSGENWNTVMYDGYLSSGSGAAVFFIVLVVVGQLIILSLFLAILMDNFEKCKSGVEAHEAFTKAIQKAKTQRAIVPEFEEQYDEDAPPSAEGRPTPAVESRQSEVVWPRDYSFWIFAPANPIRKTCLSIVSSQLFDNVILFLIVLSSLAMATDSPLNDPKSPLQTVLFYMNLVFTVIFCGEMVMKQISFGFACGKNAYWRGGWNILDGLVVIVAIIDIIPIGVDVSFVKTLRTLRALRPLRIISRNQNLKVVVNTVFKSLPELCNLVLVATLFFLIFGLFAVNAFKGGFSTCQTLDGELTEYDVGIVAASRTCDSKTGMRCDDPLKPDPLDFSWVCLDRNSSSASFGAIWSVNLAELLDQEYAIGKPCIGSSWVTGSPPSPASLLAREGSRPDRGTLLYGTGLVPPPSSDADLVLWHRPSYDSPVCEVSCPTSSWEPGADGELPDGCGPILTTDELPSVCSGTSLMDVPGVLPPHIPGRGDAGIRGEYAAWRSAATRWTMPCGNVELGDVTVEGCNARMCSGALAPTDAEIKGCTEECGGVKDVDLFFCVDVCDSKGPGPDSEECRQCRNHCETGCQCRNHCERHKDDSAMCIEQGGLWETAISQHFDSIYNGMLTLFEISTTEGWVDVMYAATDVTQPMRSPSRDNGPYWSLFFVLFILVGSFFILNLCVGVIVDNFGRMKQEGVDVMLTPAQVAWTEMRREVMKENMLFGLTNLQNVSPTRRKVFFMVTDGRFESLIMTCIVLNTFVMGSHTFPLHGPLVTDVLFGANMTFAGIFLIEAVLKIYALRTGYFFDGWNVFDFVCVAATILGVLLQYVFQIELGSVMSGIRLFRIARLFRLLRFATGLNKIFTTFLRSIPKLMNVALILLLILFLFTTMGLHTFALVRMTGAHDVHANFKDISRAVLTLLRCFTGEGWNELMHSLGRSAKYFGRIREPCVDNLKITDDNYEILAGKCLIDTPVQCGSPASAQVFFVAYTCFVTFVILNLFVAVVLEGFQDGADENEERQVLAQCIAVWKRLDPNLTLKLPMMAIPEFVARVRAGVTGAEDSDAVAMKHSFFVLGLMKVNDDSTVDFREAVEASLRLIMTKGRGEDEVVQLAEELYNVSGKQNDSDHWVQTLQGAPPPIVKEMAVRRMQNVFREKRNNSEQKLKSANTSPRTQATAPDEGTKDGEGSQGELRLPGEVEGEQGAGLNLGEGSLNRGDMPAAG
jgi:hypothetical protein